MTHHRRRLWAALLLMLAVPLAANGGTAPIDRAVGAYESAVLSCVPIKQAHARRVCYDRLVRKQSDFTIQEGDLTPSLLKDCATIKNLHRRLDCYDSTADGVKRIEALKKAQDRMRALLRICVDRLSGGGVYDTVFVPMHQQCPDNSCVPAPIQAHVEECAMLIIQCASSNYNPDKFISSKCYKEAIFKILYEGANGEEPPPGWQKEADDLE